MFRKLMRLWKRKSDEPKQVTYRTLIESLAKAESRLHDIGTHLGALGRHPSADSIDPGLLDDVEDQIKLSFGNIQNYLLLLQGNLVTLDTWVKSPPSRVKEKEVSAPPSGALSSEDAEFLTRLEQATKESLNARQTSGKDGVLPN